MVGENLRFFFSQIAKNALKSSMMTRDHFEVFYRFSSGRPLEIFLSHGALKTKLYFFGVRCFKFAAIRI